MFFPLLLLFWPLEHQETVSMKKHFQLTSSFLYHAPHASCVLRWAWNLGTHVPVKLTLHIPRLRADGTFTLYSGSPVPSSGMFASGCRSKVRKEPASKQAGKPSLHLWILCVTRSFSRPRVAAPPHRLLDWVMTSR